MNIDPRNMTFKEWSDRMNLILEPLRPSTVYFEDEDWRDWAADLLDIPTAEGQNAPDPYQFDDWQEWAERFNQVVDLPG